MLLPAYLIALGYGAADVGMVATIALLGSALMPLGVGVAGGRVDPPLVACGVLKILYDLALLRAFRHIRPPAET